VQRIFNSWESASEQLLADEILHHQISNMLAPTNISIDMNTQSNLNLDRTQIIKMVMDPINLSQDYKDIELLYTLSQRYQRTIQPTMETFVDKIEEKMTEVKEALKKNLEDAISDFQQRWMRQQ
jgi:hypothetical protein